MTSNGSLPGGGSRSSRSRRGSIPLPVPVGSGGERLRVGMDTGALGDGDATAVGRYIQALIGAFRESHSVDLTLYPDRGPRMVGPQVALPLRMRGDRGPLVPGT